MRDRARRWTETRGVTVFSGRPGQETRSCPTELGNHRQGRDKNVAPRDPDFAVTCYATQLLVRGGRHVVVY